MILAAILLAAILLAVGLGLVAALISPVAALIIWCAMIVGARNEEPRGTAASNPEQPPVGPSVQR